MGAFFGHFRHQFSDVSAIGSSTAARNHFWSLFESFWGPFGRPWRPLGTLLGTIRLPLASFCHPLDPLGIPWCPGGAIWAFFGVALAHLYHLDTTLTPLWSVLKCIFEWFWGSWSYLAVSGGTFAFSKGLGTSVARERAKRATRAKLSFECPTQIDLSIFLAAFAWQALPTRALRVRPRGLNFYALPVPM